MLLVVLSGFRGLVISGFKESLDSGEKMFFRYQIEILFNIFAFLPSSLVFKETYFVIIIIILRVTGLWIENVLLDIKLKYYSLSFALLPSS